MRNRLLPLLFVLAALPVVAGAWPVDVYVDVQAGEEKFTRFQGVDWVEVEDPKVASAEAFESGEILVTGIAPGRTLALIYGQGRFSVWRLNVVPKGQRPAVATPPDVESLARSCPKAKLEGKVLKAKVAEEKCRVALLEHLQKDGHRGEDLDLTFEIATLQSQLQDIGKGVEQLGLADRVTVRYLGAGLVLTGAVSEPEHRKLLWEIFRRSAGRAPLDDRLTVQRPDAGTPEPR